MSKILLVDDEKEFLNAIVAIVESELPDTEVFKANDGKYAWEQFQKVGPDLVITDYTMPKWNGADLVKAIHKENKNLPVILITGFAGKVETDLFTDVLLKPFKIEELIKFTKQHLHI